MSRFNSRVIIPSLTALLGALWIGIGLIQYGWYTNGKPGSGFFPAIAGALMLFVSVLAVFSEVKNKAPRFWLFHLYPVFTAVGIVLLAMLIGFFPALTIYVFAWLKYYEKYGWKTSLLTTAATIGLVYGIFAVWLRVLFPVGLLFERILG